MSKIASPDHPIHELIASRWSPYGFDPQRSVSTDDLRSLLEAARWAASSYNEQPWSYIVATRDDAELHAKVLSCLLEGNQGWAASAPVLVLTIAALNFTRNGKPNAAAMHDIGLASGNLSLEATARGLAVHQMIGILPDKAKVAFAVPDGHRVLTGLAIGFAASADALPEAIRDRDEAPRQRKPLSEFVFGEKFGATSTQI